MEAPKRGGREIVTAQLTLERLMCWSKIWDIVYQPDQVHTNIWILQKRSERQMKTASVLDNTAKERKGREEEKSTIRDYI